MLEKDRIARNTQMLAECYPSFRVRVQAVLTELESYHYRPRIQEAWRSISDQLQAYKSGHSQVQYGFHNVTGPNGEKEALAADIYDDDNPLSLKLDYVLHLAAAAQHNGLTTGVYWNLPDNQVAEINEAIATQNWSAKVHVGWDPLHTEVTGMTIQDAKNGVRPPMPDATSTSASTGSTSTDSSPTTTTPPSTTGDTSTSGDTSGNTTPPATPLVTPQHYRVKNLDTNAVQEYTWSTPFKPVVLLPVPYASQLAADASAHQNDCGAASAVMLLGAYLNLAITPDEFYSKFNITGDPFLSVAQITNAMGSLGLLTDFKANLSLQDLFTYLAANKPLIVLLRYKVLEEAGLTEKTFQGPHFAVAVGVDLKYIYLHDPLYTDPANGAAHAYPLDIFWQAWTQVGSDPSFPNPTRSAIVPVGGIGVSLVRQVRVTIPALNVRSGPGLSNAVVGSLTKDQVVQVTSELNGWGQIGDNRWIYLTYTVPVQ